jgi:hypothetical protein
MSDTPDIAAQFDADIAALSGKTDTVQEVKTDTPIAKPTEPDIFDVNTLPPAAKALLEAEKKRAEDLENRYKEADRDRRSLRGRVPHLQRKAEQWEKWEAEQKANAAKPPLVKSEPPASLLKALPEWEVHRTQYPADAAPVEAAFQALERQHQDVISKMEERLAKQQEEFSQLRELIDRDVRPRIESVDEIRRERITQAHESAQRVFAEKFSDWHTHASVALDPDTKEIKLQVSNKMGDWLDGLPGYERRAAVEVLKSRDPEDAGDVQAIFQRFYDSMKSQGQAAEQSMQAHQATQVQQTRQDNLAKRAVTGQQGVGVARADPSTFDVATAFDLDMQRLRQRK